MRLKEARERLGITQAEAAKRSELSRQAYNNYETGKRKPDIDTMLRLAKTFGTTVEWLMDGDEELTALRSKYQNNALQMMFLSLEDQIHELEILNASDPVTPSHQLRIGTSVNSSPVSKMRDIPCFNLCAVGFGDYTPEDVMDIMHIYIENDSDAANTICIKVSEDSMYPKIEDGDIIQVLKQGSSGNGDTVVILDGDKAFVRRIIHSKSGVMLESINPMYPPIRYDDSSDIHIAGVVQWVIRKM